LREKYHGTDVSWDLGEVLLKRKTVPENEVGEARKKAEEEARKKANEEPCSQQVGSGNIQPLAPPVLLSLGARVRAQFLDGQWYDGAVAGNFSAGNFPSGHLVLFDGFEWEGAYEISFDRIQPYMPQGKKETEGEARRKIEEEVLQVISPFPPFLSPSHRGSSSTSACVFG